MAIQDEGLRSEDEHIEDGFSDGVQDESTTDPQPDTGISQDQPTPGTEPEPEPQPVAETRTEEVNPGLSDVLQQEARTLYGFSDDDIASFKTDDDLTRSLSMIDRRSMDLYRQTQAPYQQGAPQFQPSHQPWSEQHQLPPQQVPQQLPPQQQQQQQQPQKEEKEWTPEKLELGLGDDFDPDVIEVLGKMNEHYHQQMIQSHQLSMMNTSDLNQLTGFAGSIAAERDAAYDQQLDDYFDSLPETYGKVFGKGRLNELPPNSQERQNRLMWEQDYGALVNMDRDRGLRELSFDGYKDRVTRTRWGNLADEATRTDIRDKASVQRRKGINRPGNNSTRKMTAEERAGDFLDQKYAEHGMLYPEHTMTGEDF